MESRELKPCPFCGGNPSVVRVGNNTRSHQIACEDCGCFLESNEKGRCGKSWNDRPSPWIEIKEDRSNLPDIEVVAVNFKEGSYGYKEKLVGYVNYCEKADWLECHSENEVLQNVTHILDPNMPIPE